MPMTFNFTVSTSLQLLSLHFVAYFKGVTRFSATEICLHAAIAYLLFQSSDY